MATKITYQCGDKTFSTAYEARKYLGETMLMAFGKTETPEEWKRVGVTKTIEEGPDVTPTPPVRTYEELAREARDKRDRLLDESDWYVMPDYPAKGEDLTVVKTYRQNLRDISKQDGFPSDIVWPTKPAVLGDGDAE